MALHKELREFMLNCLYATTTTLFSIPTLVRGITNYSKQFSIHTFHLYDTLTKKVS